MPSSVQAGTLSTPSSASLAALPPMYILSFQLDLDELHELEEQVLGLDANLTYDAAEARIFLGRVAQKKRAAFELRAKGVWTEEGGPAVKETEEAAAPPPAKRVRLSPSREQQGVVGLSKKRSRDRSRTDSASDSTASPVSSIPTSPVSPDGDALAAPTSTPPLHVPDLRDRVLVIRLDWIEALTRQNRVVPFDDYLVYDARIVPRPEGATTPHPSPSKVATHIKAVPAKQTSAGATTTTTVSTILARARAEAPSNPPAKGFPSPHQPRRRFNQNQNASESQHHSTSTSTSTPALTHPPKLHRTTTSEFEDLDRGARSLPPAPDWVRDHVVYSCCRSTPLRPPNARFIAALETIKLARILTLDEIGVRAYATSIASLAAYPFLISSEAEVLRLPGCDAKIALLWSEWRASSTSTSSSRAEGEVVGEDEEARRFLPTARALEADEDLKVLRLFYEIWGVGAETARKFYYERGWRDLDDVVEYGWGTLNRVQQIGVKFYDDFREKIPRREVERIRDVVLRHARAVRDSGAGEGEGMEAVIVGGYRRGKDESGDVDVILSHRDEKVTENLVLDVVASLEREGWVTHTLTLNTTSSDRGQQTLPYRADGGGHGFDSLDKALCVWQDPVYDDGVEDGTGTRKKNPNIHRRVDIIVSAWRTVGCAVLGWSGGNTFQRDMRRYVKKTKGWKFDSSGVRDRVSGLVLELESPRNKGNEDEDADVSADTWLDREKRLMDRLGIGWRPPSERCTG